MLHNCWIPVRAYSAQVKRAIIAERFSGKKQEQIAKKLHIGKTTVNREIEKFEEEIDSKGLQRAAEEYGVSQIVNTLYDLSVALDRNKITATEAIAGAAVAAKLKLLQKEPEDIEPFITSVYQRSKEKGYSPAQIIEDCIALQSLEDKYNGTFEQIKKTFEEMGSKLDSLRSEASNLRKEIDHAKKEQAELWAQSEIDKQGLKQFNTTKEELARLGLSIDEPEKVKNVLITIKNEQYDTRRIIAKIKAVDDLEKHTSKLAEEIAQAKEQLDSLNKQTSKTTAQLKEKQALLDEAEKLKDSHLQIKDIQAIRNTAIRIATSNGLTPQEALKKLQEDVIKNYDTILGLEPTMKSLTRRKEKLENEINEQTQDLEETRSKTKTKIAELEEQYSTRKKQIDAYLQLRRKGITDEELIRWSSILKATKLNPIVVEEELKTQKNLKHIEEATNERINSLLKREAELKESITQLESRQNAIQKSIEKVQQTGINRIEAAATATSNQTRDMLNGIATAITETSEKALNSLDDSKRRTLDVMAESEKSVGTVKQNLTAISGQIESLTNQTITAAEKIKSLHPITDAYKFIDAGIGEPKIVIPMARQFLKNLKAWLKQNGKGDMSMNMSIDSLLKDLDK